MDNNYQTMFSGDASSFDPMFSGLSLQSILTLNPSLFADYNVAGLPTVTFLTDNPPPLNLVAEPTESPKMEEKMLLLPKNEPPYLSMEEVASSEVTSQNPQPFNFFPKYQPSHFYDDTPPFLRLPELRTIERPAPESSCTHQKRLRFDPLKNWSLPTAAHHNFQCSPTVNNTFPTAKTTNYHGNTARNLSLEAPRVRGKAPSVIPQSNLARRRRQKLSEKTRCLQRLMPWDKKMDQATLLEEAYKYVKFLQAQLCVLQCMPSETSPLLMDPNSSTLSGIHKIGGDFGDLERLNRNQVLQVLVNSPVAQTMLCSQGCCVFSMEQLALLRKISERRLLQQMMMSDQASSKTFFH